MALFAPSGHFCALPGQSQVTGPCLPGFYCTGGASSPSPRDAVVGNSCPQGSYCPRGSASPVPCPAGQYSSSTGNTGIQDCLLCDAGYFCNGTGLVSPTGLCEAGFYCSGGSLSPRPPRPSASGGPCPPGHFCEEGSSRAQPCPAGTYSPSWSGTRCLQCPEGFYCTSASSNYTDCPQGHYCPRSTEFATQHPCPPGTHSEALNLWDASKCQLCPAGRVCSRPGLARPDGLCMPGWFCPPGSTSSKPMFPGNFSGREGNSEGSLCAFPIHRKGSSSSRTCWVGAESSLQHIFGVRFLVPVSPFPFFQDPQMIPELGVLLLSPKAASDSAQVGSVPAQNWELPLGPARLGSTAQEAPQSQTPAMEQWETSVPKATSVLQGIILPNHFQQGSFLPHPGGHSAQDCQPCSPGWFCSQHALSSPQGVCKEGWFCPAGSVSDQHSDYLCPVGHYCPPGSPEPVPCPPGEYQEQAGKGHCETCPAGIAEGEHKHWHFLAGSVPHKSSQVMPNRTSTAWPKPWSAQQDITAHQEPGLPGSTRAQRAPTATSPGWHTPGTAGPVLGAHSVPGQDSQPRVVCAGLGISALPRLVFPTLWVMGQGVCAQQGISALQGAPSLSPVPAAPSCPTLGWVSTIPACPVLLGSSAKEKAWLLFLDHVMLGISVTLAPHSQTTGTALLASTALKALNSQFPAALEASALLVGKGRQQTVSSAQLGTPAATPVLSPGSSCPRGSVSGTHREGGRLFLLENVIPCQSLLSFCPRLPGPGAQTPELCPAGHFCLPGTTSSTEHPCPKGTFGPRTGATSESDCEPCPAAPPPDTALCLFQGCIAQLQGCPSHLDFVTQVITVPREPPAQPPSSTG
ncbi:hypothetical protein Nmel_017353 [Mimus melanotis]